ncbi:cation-binding protein [Pseudohalioglobus sediminis]|uniref:Cation-binding protein n=2 Tax=Pseudohalioglobus sediminis TaxID=2606449 RepID=A0A5B0WTI0_9GAMM|nr:cation-binding protein [Pseudohalioglobus sediminis]
MKKKAATTKSRVSGKAATQKGPSQPAAGKTGSGYSRDAWARDTPRGNTSAEPPMLKTLRAEHRHIATVMQLFSDQLQAIDNGENVDPHIVFEVMEYMSTWPDRFHHPREDLIYSRVAELDPKAADEVDTLQRDHDHTARRGKQLLNDIESWREGDVSASVVVRRGREYIGHTYEHMNIEEKVVFPHIESILTLEDWRELAEDDELRAVSLPVFGPRVQREFRNMARRLRRGVRRGAERGAVLEWIGIEALMESLEVLSMGYESARVAAGEHWQTALDDSRELFSESPLTAPLRCSVNNMKLGYKLLGDVLEISREVFDDLEQVNAERRERIGLFDR